MIAIDIETWGVKPGYTLQPWRVKTDESGVLCLAISDGRTSTLYKTVNELFQEIHRDPIRFRADTLICGWNLKFDLAFLQMTYLKGKLQDFLFIDGMLLLKRIMPNLPTYGLKASLEHFKDIFPSYEGVYNQDIEFKVGRNPYTKEELNLMYEYNKKDAFYTHILTTHLMSIASKEDLRQSIYEGSAAYLFADAWANGIKIDKETVDDIEKNVKEKIIIAEEFFNRIGLTKEIISSSQQLQRYLSDTLELNLIERTEKGALSVTKNVLKNQIYNCSGYNAKLLRLILDYKALQTETTKFIRSAKDCLQESDYVHPEPYLSSTYTGRATYSSHHNIKERKTFKNGSSRLVNKQINIGVPIHQMKRGEMRKMFVAPEGYSLAEFDFSAQEMRLMACLADERTMIDLFNSEKDLHSYTAANIVGVDYDEFMGWRKTKPDEYKKIRFLGKLTNLSLQYRLSAASLYKQWHDVYGLTDKSLIDAQIARQTYIKIYSGVPEYWACAIESAKNSGYAKNMAGKKHPIIDWGREDEWSASQTAINFPIQSTGAEQKTLALAQLREYITRQGVKFVWDLHDGLYFYIPKGEAQLETILAMQRIFDNLPYASAWDWQPQIKFPVEVKLGANWGELKNVVLS